jgi:cell division protein FtsB
MQPDLLSIHQEDEQAELVSPQDLTQSERLSIPDAAPLAPAPVKEIVNPQPVLPTEKKRFKLNFAVIGLVLFVFVLFMAFGWVGYWAYTLNTELVSTQQQLAALQAKQDQLQAEYTTLTSEKDKLNADLIQSKTDLEKANTDLTSVQADLSQSKQNGDKLETKLEKASDLVEILFVTATSDEESDIFKIDRLITESNNPELIKQWDTFTAAPSDDAFSAFLDYLVLAARDSLK